MRDYVHQPVGVVKDIVTRDILSVIDYYLQDLSKGVARIQKGQVPDGSGDTIINQVISDLYWYKPGHTNFGTAFMETAPGGGGVISSTKHSTKGSVYLGTAKTTVYDEVNDRIGIGDSTPSAKLDILVPNPIPQTIIPDADDTDGTWLRNDTGTAVNLYQGTLNPTDTNWISTASFGSSFVLSLSPATNPSQTSNFSVTVRMKTTTAAPNSGNLKLTLDSFNGSGFTSFVSNRNPDGNPTLTTSFANYTYTLTAGDVGGILDYTNMRVGMGFGGAQGSATSIEVSYIKFNMPSVGGGSAETLQKWETAGGASNLLDYGDDGTGTTQIVFSGTPYMSFANGGLRFNMASPAAGKVWEATDSTGTGAWLHPSALATKQVHVWTANGFYRVDGDVDGARTIPRAASATNFILYRRLGGSSGGTGVTLLRNGVSVLSSDPGIAFNAGASATAAGTFSATAWAATSVFTVSASAVDGGRPRDWVALLEVYA